MPGRHPDGCILASVLDVLPMRGDDERRPRRELPEKTCRDEEVRVDDVRPEPACDAQRVEREREVASPSPRATVDDSPLELVPACNELALEVGHEHPEIGIVGPRVHLRDEKDSQRAYPRVT